MDAIYSATALRDHQKEVKEAARRGVVRITEHGKGAFVFCSEEVFQRRIAQAVDDALYARRAKEAIARGTEAYESGDYVVGLEAAKALVEEIGA